MIIDDPKQNIDTEEINQEETGIKGGKAEAETSDVQYDTGDMSYDNDEKDTEE